MKKERSAAVMSRRVDGKLNVEQTNKTSKAEKARKGIVGYIEC